MKPSTRKSGWESRKAASYVPVEAVEVLAWGHVVGAIARDPRSGFYAFAYAPAFLKNGVELAPIQMPLSQGTEPIIFSDLPEATYRRLPALVADSLPDDFGNALIDAYMATRGISRERITPLDRLAYMGSRGMGVLEFRPNRGPKTKTATAIDLRDLVQNARDTVSGRLGSNDDTWLALRNLIEVGTSAGGARAKAVIAWNPVTNEIRSGQTVAPEGFEHWLLKFDGLGADSELGTGGHYGRIEYAYFLMARAAGATMSDCRLLEENGRAHFMTRRFDRRGDRNKVHIQTLCAMNHIDYKKRGANTYEQLFMTLDRLSLPVEDFEETFRRMVFNIVAMNCDDHSKNFSFMCPQGGAWTIAPFYDVSFAHNPSGEWTRQHLMSTGGIWMGHERSDLMSVGDRFGIGRAGDIIDQVVSAAERWTEFAREAGVRREETARIAVFIMENITRMR